MSAQLALTALDRRVLTQLERGRPGRASEIADIITRTGAAPTEQEIAEVRRILRGAEHLGLVRCNRGGWWRITEAGRRALAERVGRHRKATWNLRAERDTGVNPATDR